MRETAFLAIILCVVGCSNSEERRVESVVSERLKDPDSAKFAYVSMARSGSHFIACGDVNSKNSFGAYTGNTAFMVWDQDVFIDGPFAKPVPGAIPFCCIGVRNALKANTGSDKAESFQLCKGMIEPFKAG